ncbi:MAG: hypothetical protein QN131_07110 [Armatimonadota bacterium]|nr:hypothetical protein [Armatimonadota bacterium]MDR7549687.1 hypothetical protein [Armatimonadota bacterium]
MARQVMREGFRDVRVLAGGWRAWLDLGAQVQASRAVSAAS